MSRISKSLVLAFVLSLTLAASAQAAELTISTDRESVDYRDVATLSGELKGLPNPDGTPIELVAIPYPYEREKVIKTGEVAESGYWEFTVQPGLNTRYYVRAAGIRSQEKFVWVAPLFRFEGRQIGGEKSKVRLHLFFGADYPRKALKGKRVWWYVARVGAKAAKRVGQPGRVRFVAPGHLLARGRVPLNSIPDWQQYRVYFCLDVHGDAGIFQPGAKGCPRRLKLK